MQQKFIRFLGDHLWRRHHADVLGVFLGKKELCLAAGRLSAAGFTLSRITQIALPAEFSDGSAAAERYVPFLQKAVATEGFWHRVVLIALPGDRVFSCKKEFPLMTAEELAEAVKWEIEELVPDPEVHWDYGYRQLRQTPEGIEVAIEAIPGRLQTLWESLQTADLELVGVVKMQPVKFVDEPGGIKLLFGEGEQRVQLVDPLLGEEELHSPGVLAAMQAAVYSENKSRMINLLPSDCQESAVDWQKLFRLATAVLFLFLLAMHTGGWLQQRALERTAVRQAGELELLQESRERREAIAEKQRGIEQKNTVLAMLSEERISGQSIFMHLGFLTVEGVRLTTVELKDVSVLCLCGEAMDYSSLAKFLAKFEQDEFFRQVVLVDSGQKPERYPGEMQVKFMLKMKVENIAE